MNLLHKLLTLLIRLAFGPIESVKIGFRFHLEAIDPDGTRHGGSPQDLTLTEPTDWRRMRFGAQALVLALVLSSCWFFPASSLVVPIMGRVTTAGLNALLSSTLANSVTSTTWFVGLCKYVASDGVTNGTTTFTSASGTFAAGDVGRNILLRGAGVAGADLATTIAARASATSITLTTGASNSATGVQYALECRAADTMASHTSFVESATYSNVTRPAWTPGAVSAGSVDNSGAVAVFNINGTDFIFGAFLTSNSTISGSTGTLYGMGVNSGGVALAVTSGSTVNVTITATATAT